MLRKNLDDVPVLLASRVALVVNNPPANTADERDVTQSLGQEDPLE